MTFTGIEAINSESNSHTCKADLVMKGETAITLSTVQYQGSITPALTKISPRWGTVVGGTDVVFTGTGFSAT